MKTFDLKDFKNEKILEYLQEKEKVGDNDYSQLQEFLYSLVKIFEYDPDGIPLYELIQKDWELFVSDSACIKVMDSIIALDVDDIKKARITDCTSKVVYQKSITGCVDVWETLKEDIKNHHRFTTSLDKLKDAGWDTLLDNKMLLNPDTVYYRARIRKKKSDSFGTNDMGAPDVENCTPGRANPEGIPYLYLCEEVKTTLYETKVNKHDVVTIGHFQIADSNPLFVEDLTDIDLNAVNLLDEDVVTLAKRKLLIRALSSDMSKPMHRFDSNIEYVPTQFICEYVSLTQDVSGIRFSSSVYKQGTNLVIFKPGLMKCIEVENYLVKDLDITEELYK